MSNPVEQFIRNIAVPPVVMVVATDKAIDCRICVTADKGTNWPVWITVHKTKIKDASGSEIDGLFASTNDMDFMVGYPPSFYQSTPLDQPEQMVESICRFLSEKLAGAERCEVKLIPTTASGAQALPILVGNSDRSGLSEQPEFPSL